MFKHFAYHDLSRTISFLKSSAMCPIRALRAASQPLQAWEPVDDRMEIRSCTAF